MLIDQKTMHGINSFVTTLILSLLLSHSDALPEIRRDLSEPPNDFNGCVDSKKKFELPDFFPGGLKFDCEWVENDLEQRCMIEEVRIQCPRSCGLCSYPEPSYESDQYEWCEDSDDEVEIGSKTVKCRDVAKKNNKNAFLCNFPSVKSLCPRTCGNCECNNNQESFVITSDGYHKGHERTCSWVDRYSYPRCNISDSVANCPEVCGQCSNAPSQTPSAPVSPEPTLSDSFVPSAKPSVEDPTCRDSSEKFLITSDLELMGARKTCSWAKRKTFWRCTISEVEENCPDLCGVCSTCEDKNGLFTLINPWGKEVRKGCPWVAREDTYWRCNRFIGAKENCPKTCKVCYVPPIETESPSESPSASVSPSASIPSSCEDEVGWTTYDPNGKWSGKTCAQIAELPGLWCQFLKKYSNLGKSTYEACCACGGGDHLSVLPSTFPSTAPSVSPSISSQPSLEESSNPSSAPSACVDEDDWFWDFDLGYGCKYLSPSFCNDFIDQTVNGKNSLSACCVCGGGVHLPVAPSATPSTSSGPSSVPSIKGTTPPSISVMPVATPSSMPTARPSTEPSPAPSDLPSVQPSSMPSGVPTITLSKFPSRVPSSLPSMEPSTTYSPTVNRSNSPSASPSLFFSASPSACVDEPGWTTTSDNPFFSGRTCTEIADRPQQWCTYKKLGPRNGKSASEACCVCGGGDHVPVQPSQSPSQHPSNAPSVSSYPTTVLSESPSAAPSQCMNDPTYIWDTTNNYDCTVLTSAFCLNKVVNGKTSYQACCACGGGTHVQVGKGLVIPSPVPVPTPAPVLSTQSSSQSSSPPSNGPSAAPSKCVDDPAYIWDTTNNYGCSKLTVSFCGDTLYGGLSSKVACCVCGGGSHVTGRI